MPRYEASIIERFAEKLYARANWTIAIYTLIGAAVGFGGSFYFALQAREEWIYILGIVVGAAIGFYMGTQRAFMLKLQAQTALCQIEIERNTRAQPAPR